MHLLSRDELWRTYGDSNPPERLSLDRHNVPEEFWPLIPYAEFWGLRDDADRMQLVDSAPLELLQNLKAVVTANEKALQKWLAGDAADATPTDEYIAFCTLIMASDFVWDD